MSSRAGRRRPPFQPPADWQPYDAADPVFVAALLEPDWELVRLLGRGALACTHLVARRADGQRAVARIVHANIAEDESARAHFRRLARAVLALDHPNLVRTLAVSPDGGVVPWAVCEFVEGTDLASLLAAERRLSPARALAIARDVAAALGAAHARGITHGNLRLSDILIAAGDGRARVYELDSPLFGGRGLLGNPRHAAPEQLEDPGSGPRPSADLFALGTILYEMLAGEPPFPGETTFEQMARKRKGDWVPLRKHLPGIPRAVENLVECLLSPDPARRGTAAQAESDLVALEGSVSQDA
jgi:serine/threonine protein kinase